MRTDGTAPGVSGVSRTGRLWRGLVAGLGLASLGLAASGCFFSHDHRRSAPETSDESTWSTADPQLLFGGVRIRRDGETQRLRLDEPLYTGDEISLDLETPEPSYLYIVNIAPDGTRHVAYPSLRPTKGTGGPGSWFKLNAPSGQELVAILVTHREVRLDARGKEWLVKVVEREAARDGLTRVQSTRPPGVGDDGYATMGLRARSLRPEGEGFRVEGSPHYAVLLLDLDHRARD